MSNMRHVLGVHTTGSFRLGSISLQGSHRQRGECCLRNRIQGCGSSGGLVVMCMSVFHLLDDEYARSASPKPLIEFPSTGFVAQA